MIKTKLRMAHIFVPGGFPNITYISRDAHQLEARVRAARDNLCKLVVVTGTTKSGKTVLVDKISLNPLLYGSTEARLATSKAFGTRS